MKAFMSSGLLTIKHWGGTSKFKMLHLNTHVWNAKGVHGDLTKCTHTQIRRNCTPFIHSKYCNACFTAVGENITIFPAIIILM